MFIRFSRDYDAGSGAFFENGKVYDLDRTIAQAFINAGAAALSTAPQVGYNPASVAITGGTMSGVVVTGGSINSAPVGNTIRNSGAFGVLSLTAIDSTGTPGNVTNNNANGRAAFAAAGASVVVTNSFVAAADTVQVTLLGVADATLDRIVGVTVAAGSFTVIGNAAATAAKGFMFTVIKA